MPSDPNSLLIVDDVVEGVLNGGGGGDGLLNSLTHGFYYSNYSYEPMASNVIVVMIFFTGRLYLGCKYHYRVTVPS